MRTVTIYQFDELSPEAQENAIRAICEDLATREYPWGDEAIETAEKVCEHFDYKLKNYSIDWDCPGRSTYQITDAFFNEEFTEEELRLKIEQMGSYSANLKGDGDCKFTGVCFDEDFCDGVREEYFKGTRNIRDLLTAGMEELLRVCQADYEYLTGKEEAKNRADEYEFTENGDIA